MRRLIAIATLLVLVFVACGDDKESDAEREKEEATSVLTCSTPPADLTSGTGGLAAAFPKPAGVHYTESRPAGPSTIVEGYVAYELNSAYAAYQAVLDKAPYSVTKSEKDAHDAEVNFAGEKTTGQVKLTEECKGRTHVSITARPE
jgi:hypothetical protein